MSGKVVYWSLKVGVIGYGIGGKHRVVPAVINAAIREIELDQIWEVRLNRLLLISILCSYLSICAHVTF